MPTWRQIQLRGGKYDQAKAEVVGHANCRGSKTALQIPLYIREDIHPIHSPIISDRVTEKVRRGEREFKRAGLPAIHSSLKALSHAWEKYPWDADHAYAMKSVQVIAPSNAMSGFCKAKTCRS